MSLEPFTPNQVRLDEVCVFEDGFSRVISRIESRDRRFLILDDWESDTVLYRKALKLYILNWVNRPTKETYVYFITTVTHVGTYLKIGVASNPFQRLNELQTANPMPLKLISYTPGGMEVEKVFHNIWKDHRRRGEWFSASSDMRYWLQHMIYHRHGEIFDCFMAPGEMTKFNII